MVTRNSPMLLFARGQKADSAFTAQPRLTIERSLSPSMLALRGNDALVSTILGLRRFDSDRYVSFCMP
jgi:hypothetical protein